MTIVESFTARQPIVGKEIEQILSLPTPVLQGMLESVKPEGAPEDVVSILSFVESELRIRERDPLHEGRWRLKVDLS